MLTSSYSNIHSFSSRFSLRFFFTTSIGWSFSPNFSLNYWWFSFTCLSFSTCNLIMSSYYNILYKKNLHYYATFSLVASQYILLYGESFWFKLIMAKPCSAHLEIFFTKIWFSICIMHSSINFIKKLMADLCSLQEHCLIWHHFK